MTTPKAGALEAAIGALRKGPSAVAVTCLVVAALLLALMRWQGPPPSAAGEGQPDAAASAAAPQGGELAVAVGELNGTLETIFEREVVWQLPPAFPKGGAKGVAFFAHGCTHTATHFWPEGSGCPSCIGLPEDQALVRRALSRGYAVIAVSSLGLCWQAQYPLGSSQDAQDVVRVLGQWRDAHGLSSLPLVALGASSGGYFITSLAHAVELASLAVIIASGVQDALGADPPFGKPFPPTLFVHMPRDTSTAVNVAEAVRLLRAKSVPAAELLCGMKPLSEHFFSDRIPGVDHDLSDRMFAALVDAGLVRDDGYVKPKYQRRWEEVLGKKGLLASGPPHLVDKIFEELAFAYGLHEMTSEYADEIVDWFDGVCKRKTKSGTVEASQGRCTSLP